MKQAAALRLNDDDAVAGMRGFKVQAFNADDDRLVIWFNHITGECDFTMVASGSPLAAPDSAPNPEERPQLESDPASVASLRHAAMASSANTNTGMACDAAA